MVRLGLEDGLQVVHDLHRSRVKSGGARRSGDDRHLRAFAPCAQCGAVPGDAAADDDDATHYRITPSTMPLVSATSRVNCCTTSSTVRNAMSACRERTKSHSRRCC